MENNQALVQEFSSFFVDTRGVSLSERQKECLQIYFLSVLEENKVQNLTRLTSPSDFFFGHVVDCLELLRAGWISENNIDLGSGAGIPGVISAILAPHSRWILVESEKLKARFLNHLLKKLGLDDRVEVFAGRMEHLEDAHFEGRTIFSRAVGKISKIYPWIEHCSTWNNIVLFKGPSWATEWEEWMKGPNRSRLKILRTHEYSVQGKFRVLVDIRKNK